MAALNRGAVVSAVANIGAFDNSAGNALTKLQQLVQAAEGVVWGAGDWIFKKVGPQAITFDSSGFLFSGLPTDFGSSLQVLDDQENPLTALEPDQFDRLYQTSIIQQQKQQRPEAYKIVNRTLYYAPLPVAPIAGYMSYKRRQCHYLSDGVTIVKGEMTLDTDLPLWPSNHHMVLVWCALVMVGVSDADVAAILWDQSYESALQAMVDELTGTDTGTTSLSYGRDTI